MNQWCYLETLLECALLRFTLSVDDNILSAANLLHQVEHIGVIALEMEGNRRFRP